MQDPQQMLQATLKGKKPGLRGQQEQVQEETTECGTDSDHGTPKDWGQKKPHISQVTYGLSPSSQLAFSEVIIQGIEQSDVFGSLWP